MTRREALTDWLPLGLVALAFAAANGIGYGGGNLHQYLLHGLHAADPGFLAHDWFTVQTRPHHVLFTALIGLLARVAPPDLTLGLLNVVSASIFAVCVQAMARRLHHRPLLITATTLIIMLGSPRTLIALVSMITSYFQPSTVGALGLLGGMILLAKRRWNEAALTFAIGGVFHIGYAIWIVLLIAAVLVRHARMFGVRRSLLFVGVAALVGIFHAPFFLTGRSPEQLQWSALAGRIIHDVYMPFHSRPRTWPAEQWISAACVLSAGVVATMVMRRPRRTTDIERTLAGFVAVISIVGLALTLAFEWDIMAMLLPYRVLLVAMLAAQVSAAAALIVPPPRERTWLHHIAIQALIFVLIRRSGVSEYAGVTIAFAGAALTASRAARDLRLSTIRAAGIGVMLYVLLRMAGARSNILAAFVVWSVAFLTLHRINRLTDAYRVARRLKVVRFGAAAILVVQLTWMARAAADREDFLCEPYSMSEIELFDWCRNHTPPDAVFAIPPDLAGFRLHAQRATIIDFKCMPILPADTVRWGQRLAAVCGRPIRSLNDATQAYRQLDPSRVASLREKFGVTYVITERPWAKSDRLGPTGPIYANKTYAVHLIESTVIGSAVAEPDPSPASHPPQINLCQFDRPEAASPSRSANSD